ncbi:arsinothricin resistance N-acetyltransferase ArsN1 family A [Robertmurraya massiliosenegalensis]|uniref:arsinothricin resistance N-acetyltransferase ArsN1 family A n=1 Tax=Robertmurraya massiliosenegalensis TaxID=1287657 RepID=UPI0002DE9BBD|nr:arsinothricin resistance N-acetyltransferase ArsN1 family A [Robertmurraya massiliosenegalensis]
MKVRQATSRDVENIMNIYNQGIEDRVATLETEPKNQVYMEEWFKQLEGRYKVIVAEEEGTVKGWASLNPYNNRCAYSGVADLSVYIARDSRGKGIGGLLLTAIDEVARQNGFHKIVLFTFPFNQLGQRLYHKAGYREVGTFKNQGILDGEFVDVMSMEKILIN